jgi:multidrug efflux pump subunit AcrA (membrane-fusion protein)
VQQAEARLREVQAGPAADQQLLAASKADSARLAVQQAEARLREVQAGPAADQQLLAASKADSARLAVQQAEARLRDVQGGPSADQQLLVASKADSARLAVQQAEARLADIKGHPTPDELARAQDQVAIARLGLSQARGEGASADAPGDAQSFDRVLAQMAVDQDQADVQRLEQDLAATRLTAPFAGLITAVRVRPGDALDPSTPAIVLAPPSVPVVRVEITADQAARLAAGQGATLRLDGADAPIDATVSNVASNPEAGGRVALLDVRWPGESPVVGTSADVQVILQQKNDVLLVPKSAVRTVGNRRTAEIVAGSGRRATAVETGITSDKDVEIVSGLLEGQLVLPKP